MDPLSRPVDSSPATRVVCAPDGFKGTLSASRAAAAMARGCRRAWPGIVCDECPVADGGEGTMETIVAATGGRLETLRVTGPLGEPIDARIGLVSNGRRAVVELAEASGLTRIPPGRLNPEATTTFGTGELIAAAAARGAESILLCLGGSGTVDGGAGMAQALGAVFFDEHDEPFGHPMTGADLSRLGRIERCRWPARLVVASDVSNPLCGANGAAAVYGPQKGATAEQVARLDSGLANLATVARHDPGFPGAGAAGGAAYGAVALLGAEIRRGIDLVLDVLDFETRCHGAALALTGEGRLDGQTLEGKACLGVAAAAGRQDVPTIAIVGSTGEGADACVGSRGEGLLEKCVSLSKRYGAERAMEEAEQLVETAAEEVVRGIGDR